MEAFVKDNYQILIEKLDEFIRKYYINQMLRGALYFTAGTAAIFLIFSLLESQFYFDTGVRRLMFYSYLGMFGIGLVYWIVIPLVHYFRLGRVISHEKAAQIIGKHFDDIDDKLINVLQLKKQSYNVEQRELIEAAIRQKTNVLLPLPFTKAVNLGENKKYLKYALIPLLLIFGILFLSPELISDSSKRIIQNNKDFERIAPFKFVLDEDELRVVQHEDFLLKLNLVGQSLPNDVFVSIGDYQYRMNKIDIDQFEFVFKNVSQSIDFRLYAAGFYSLPYRLEVLKKPSMAIFEVRVIYPAYTQMKPDIITNVGDLILPIGSKVEWQFKTENTSNLYIKCSEEELILSEKKGNDLFVAQRIFKNPTEYGIFLQNENYGLSDSLFYKINIIPDLYPEISVDEFRDSTSKEKILYFAGNAKDDYGIKSIHFKYQIQKYQSKPLEEEKVLIKSASEKNTDFTFIWDYQSITLSPGDRITYYFEVADNDGVNGSKTARTPYMTIQKPTLEELAELTEKNNKDIKDNIANSIQEATKLQREIKSLKEKLLQQKEMDWQRKKDLEKLLEKQQKLEELLKETRDKFKENKENLQENEMINERLQEKQDKIEEIMDQIVDPETQQLMEKIQELMKELNKENSMKLMDQMQNKNKEKELELDRLMELFKTLEVEYELQKHAEQLKELAREQDQQANHTENKNKSAEQLSKEQEDLNKKFEQLSKKLEETLDKNKELQRPKKLEDIPQEIDDIKKEMQDAKNQLQKDNRNNAKQKQKNSSKKMNQLSEKMENSMQSGEMEQMEEDMRALRQILENLITLSYNQEDLIKEFSRVNSNTSAYVDLVREQSRIRDNFRIVEDSLHALSKRVFQLESFITEKLQEIRNNIGESIGKLEDRKKNEAADNQQRTMKNLNDLALMLSETMEQMQQAMSSMMPGSQMCSKPGKNKGEKPGQQPMDKITEGQKGVSEEMKKLKEQRDKNGKEGGNSKEFAEIAAKQAALRKALEQLQKENKERGRGDKNLQEIIDQMNKNEIDLVNKRLTNETLKRQQDIITRLLEAERAEREQDWDDKRKAERPNEIARALPPSMEEYLKKRQAEVEEYRTLPANMRPFYKNLIDQYYKHLEN